MSSESEAANVRALAGLPEQASPRVLPVLPAALLSPERMRTLTWCGGSVAGCAVVCVAVTAAAPGRDGAVIFLLAPLLVAAAGPAIRRWRLRKLVTDGSFRELSDQAVGTALSAALRPVGVTQVAVPRQCRRTNALVPGRPAGGRASARGRFAARWAGAASAQAAISVLAVTRARELPAPRQLPERARPASCALGRVVSGDGRGWTGRAAG